MEMKSLFNSSYAINIGDVDFVHLIQYSPDFVLRVFILELWKLTTECSLHMRAEIGALITYWRKELRNYLKYYKDY